jgi:hypothetical protein
MVKKASENIGLLGILHEGTKLGDVLDFTMKDMNELKA